MPARRREPAEQRLAPLLLVEVKALRIDTCAANFLMFSAVKVNEPTSRRWPISRSSKKSHQAAPPSRRLTMIGDTISHSACPPALRTVPLNVTMPVSGRLFDTRASATSTSSVSSSSGRKRRQPAHLVDAGRAERGGAADEAVEHHPHHDRAEMPARAGQPLEHRSAGGLLVEMHRLRVEFGGKGQDFLARDAARSERAETAGREVFECQRGHDWGN